MKESKTLEGEFEEVFLRHIDSAKHDVVLLTLKGLLVIEYALNELLKELLPYPDSILNTNPGSFSRKVALLEALLERPSMSGQLIEPMKALASARNYLAHDLEAKDIEKKIWSFIKCKDLLAIRGSRGPGALTDKIENELAVALMHVFISLQVERFTRRRFRLEGRAFLLGPRSNDPN